MSTISKLTFLDSDHYITSSFGWRTLRGKSNYHSGTDYGTNCKNVPVYALEEGYVYSKGYESWGAGYYIWIAYPDINKRFLYCHLKSSSPLAKGNKVLRGTLIGYTGTTGNSTGIHLHLGCRDLTTGTYEDVEKFSLSYNPDKKAAAVVESKHYIVNTFRLRVRTGPGTNYRQKVFSEFTANAKQQILKLNGNRQSNCFCSGMEFDALEIKNNWARTYSGWLCLDYCKKG